MNLNKLLKLDIDSKRIFGLDILRAFAILFVLIIHANLLLPIKYREFLNFLAFDGVSIFFVLSGFLIGNIILKTLEKGNISLSVLLDFWKKRWLRTLPNYFFILIVLCLLNICFLKGFKLYTAVPFFFFLQNINKPYFIFFNDSWSLSVEEWFYLIIPAILFFIAMAKDSSKKTVISLAVFLIIAILAFRYWRYISEPKPANPFEYAALFYYPVITRIDGIMFGIVGAFFSFYYVKLWSKFRSMTFFGGLLILIADRLFLISNPEISNTYICVYTFSVKALATLMLLPYLSNLKSGSGFIYKVITYISLTSYSMYIINNSIINVWGINFLTFFLKHAKIELNISTLYIVEYIFSFTATFVGSIILYKYLELPFMKLRHTKASKIEHENNYLSVENN